MEGEHIELIRVLQDALDAAAKEKQRYLEAQRAIALAVVRLERHAAGIHTVVEELTTSLTGLSPNGTPLYDR